MKPILDFIIDYWLIFATILCGLVAFYYLMKGIIAGAKEMTMSFEDLDLSKKIDREMMKNLDRKCPEFKDYNDQDEVDLSFTTNSNF